MLLTMALKDDMWVRRFVVSDPVKHKKGFTLYKVTSVVFPKKHPEAVTKIVVWKRYNDFKKLHKELKLKYQKLQLTDKFPPFVKAKFFKRFEDDVIEERRQAALVLLEFVAQHSPLFTSDVFVKFFQCGYSVNSTTGTIEKIEPCVYGIVQPFPVDNSWSPTFKKRDDLDTIPVISSEDDVTSFTTDTDSAISSPLPSSIDFTWPPVDDGADKDQKYKSKLPDDNNESDVLESTKINSQNKYDCAAVYSNESIRRSAKTVDQSTRYPKVKIKEVPLCVLWKPIDDLQYFKVLGVYAKVMLVIDTRDDSLHIVKAHQKTSYPVYNKQNTIFPRQIPYMVNLQGIFETSSAIYLVIQNVSSGKLWDYVTPYFQSSVPKASSGNTSRQGQLSKDIYDDRSERKSSSASNCSISTNLTTTLNHSQSSLSSSDNETSYLELIKDYTSGERVDLKPLDPKKSETINSSVSTENIVRAGHKRKATLNNSKSEGALNICDDDLIGNLTKDITLFNLVAERFENGTWCGDLNDKTYDHINTDTSSTNVKINLKIKSSETVINLLTNSATDTDNSLKIENGENCTTGAVIPDVHIDNLVENARKLLQSVDETLLKSDCLVNRLDTCVNTDDVIDNLLQDTLSCESDVVCEKFNTNLDSISSSNLITKSRILLNAEKIGSNESSPDSRISRSPVHSPCHYDTSRLHPPSPYSRACSPVSSVSTDGEGQWWKQEIEGNGLKEETIKKWATQLLVAINALHEVGIICRDLNPDNILVQDGNIRLTYFCQFVGVEPPIDYKAVKKLYCAPEVMSIFPATESADWWSFGAILYELTTGQNLASCHPGGFHCHTILYIPEYVSLEAQSLLNGLLQFNPSERLCSGAAGVAEIKCHPFFAGVNWDRVFEDGLTAS